MTGINPMEAKSYPKGDTTRRKETKSKDKRTCIISYVGGILSCTGLGDINKYRAYQVAMEWTER
jgi:hypothetical protein